MTAVSKCVDLLTEAICNVDKRLELSETVYNFDEKNKIDVIKNKNVTTIYNLITLWHNLIIEAVRTEIGKTVGKVIDKKEIKLYMGSSNTQLDADLYAIVQTIDDKIIVELKLSKNYVDKNPTAKSVNEAIGFNLLTDNLTEDIRKKWQKQLVEDKNEDNQLKRLHEAIKQGAIEFNNTHGDTFLSEENSRKFENLMFFSGNSGAPKYFLKMVLNEENLVVLPQPKLGQGLWKVHKITDVEGINTRVDIIFTNDVIKKQVKCSTNWKQNKIVDGFSIRSCMGIVALSYNCYISDLPEDYQDTKVDELKEIVTTNDEKLILIKKIKEELSSLNKSKCLLENVLTYLEKKDV